MPEDNFLEYGGGSEGPWVCSSSIVLIALARVGSSRLSRKMLTDASPLEVVKNLTVQATS